MHVCLDEKEGMGDTNRRGIVTYLLSETPYQLSWIDFFT